MDDILILVGTSSRYVDSHSRSKTISWSRHGGSKATKVELLNSRNRRIYREALGVPWEESEP